MNTLPNIRPPVFRVGDVVYYPAHGVGTVVGQETRSFGFVDQAFYVVYMERDRLTLRVPVAKASESGLQLLSHFANQKQITEAMSILAGKRKVRRAMWSRRALEFRTKIHHGNLKALAEVVRDINRDRNETSEISYSEQQLLKEATLRFVEVVATLQNREAEEVLEGINMRIERTKLPLEYKRW